MDHENSKSTRTNCPKKIFLIFYILLSSVYENTFKLYLANKSDISAQYSYSTIHFLQTFISKILKSTELFSDFSDCIDSKLKI